ncbi:MAG: enoyl-CoA hydratase/isomerase family protein [Chloroflexi bacterium]|nr:enoyl-CoA hydratase/isomerase family protein [Chloroflexota bacterium]
MALIYEKKGRIATITFNRPEAFNAMDPTTLQEFSASLMDFREDADSWVLIVTGAGEKAFCAGADVKSMIPLMREWREKPWLMPPSIVRGMELAKPVIGAINGLALGGGCEIALACDLRIASEKASFGTPEVKLGLIPGWGGTQRLPRMIPMAKAAEILLTGAAIDAQEAYRLGLVNKVVPPAQLMPAAQEMAEAICKNGPLAVRAAKEAMIKAKSLSLEEGLRLEWTLFSNLFLTEDFKEGTGAFVEKRKPNFQGK